ncbi:unnamed protein product [Moneuplotes crassus]|uniref:Uncharacterized protein n=1 Tax=Euplotes crassus TaxID=5936 RepID=A0AAD1XHW3_EUPCR|nr:unnamed protein product [Moneuplotes crassus]
MFRQVLLGGRRNIVRSSLRNSLYRTNPRFCSTKEKTDLQSREERAIQAKTRTVSIQEHRTKAIKPLDEKYSLDATSTSRVHKVAEKAMENIFFKIEEKEVTMEEALALQRKDLVIEGLGTRTGSINEGRNIYSDGNELAHKTLQDNIIDFHDKRVKVTTQKKSAWKSQINEDLVQIDLGNVKSLKQSEVMADKVDLSSLPQGMNIIDENTNKTEYDLLLVGRKMKKGEQEEHHLAPPSDSDGKKHDIKHFINQDIFHEADMSTINKGVKKDEGVLMYYTRNFGNVVLLLFGISCLNLIYSLSMNIGKHYEDYLDYSIYQHFKRKRKIQRLITLTYLLNIPSTNA